VDPPLECRPPRLHRPVAARCGRSLRRASRLLAEVRISGSETPPTRHVHTGPCLPAFLPRRLRDPAQPRRAGPIRRGLRLLQPVRNPRWRHPAHRSDFGGGDLDRGTPHRARQPHPHVHRIVAAVSVDGGRFADVHDLRITATTTGPAAEYMVQPAATTETALVCLEIYRRDGTWRLRAVGQGYDDGLAGLTRDFSIDVAYVGSTSGADQLIPRTVSHGLSTCDRPQHATTDRRRLADRYPRPFDYRLAVAIDRRGREVQLPRTAPNCAERATITGAATLGCVAASHADQTNKETAPGCALLVAHRRSRRVRPESALIADSGQTQMSVHTMSWEGRMAGKRAGRRWPSRLTRARRIPTRSAVPRCGSPPRAVRQAAVGQFLHLEADHCSDPAARIPDLRGVGCCG